MEQVSPTRTELLFKKSQINLANQGKELLKQKRDALMMEFMNVLNDALRLSSFLQRVMAEGQYALVTAQAVDGVVTVKSTSFATKGNVTVDVSGTQVMGVPLPVVTKGLSPVRSGLARGYSITGVSSRISETAEKFEKIIDLIIDNAHIETRLRRLGEEIQKTNRRVNALEHIVVPAFKQQVAYIKMTLEERAREDLFRLKKVKKSIEKKKKKILEAKTLLA
ncbi:MAG: V-type ATP synthase subunit D [Candidatus Firestonebacteria bacterium]|nr:V-type ATP synthase subunit D [Candidatus Firestonebacteria bacterium]